MRPYLKELTEAGLTSLIMDVRGIGEPLHVILGDSEKFPKGKYTRANAFSPEQKGVTRGHFFKGVL